jgi:hypothetical protein
MEITTTNVKKVIADIMQDPSTSFWFKVTLESALKRDPVDAANDAEVMAKLLSARCAKILDMGEGL